MTAVRSRFVNCRGVRTHYSEAGEHGAPIIALHGGGSGASGRAGFDPLLSRLPDDMVMYALDSVGGFGETDVSAPVPYGLMSRVHHLADFQEALGLDRVTLLGNSQGAWVAARYATMYPDRVDRLIMIGSGTIGQAFGIKQELTPERLAKVNSLIGEDGTREGLRTGLGALYYDKGLVTEEILDLRFTSANRPGARDRYKSLQQATRRLQNDPVLFPIFDLSKALPAFAKVVPTIFIWGENDDFAVPELGHELDKRLPEIPFHWVNHAGHQVQTDQPEETMEIIANFMRTSPAGGW